MDFRVYEIPFGTDETNPCPRCLNNNTLLCTCHETFCRSTLKGTRQFCKGSAFKISQDDEANRAT
jgi:hypothetical protein